MGVVPIDLGVLPGHVQGSAERVNNRGDIVGSSKPAHPSNEERAVLWRGGGIIDLGTLGGDRSSALFINFAGQVAGVSDVSPFPGRYHAYLWENGMMTDVGVLGDVNTAISTIRAFNGRGQIAGITSSVAEHDRAILWSRADGLRPIGPTSVFSSRAYDLNESGIVAGAYQAVFGDGTLRAFVGDDHGYTTLADMGAGAVARFVNDAGDVAGEAYVETPGHPPQPKRAVIWRGGVLIDLQVPVGDPLALIENIEVTGLSETGYVVGVRHKVLPDQLLRFHGWVWDGARVVELGQVFGRPRMNRLGWIGYTNFEDFDVADLRIEGRVWHDGEIIHLETLGGPSMLGGSVNEVGQVVGLAANGSGVMRPALWTIPVPPDALIRALLDRLGTLEAQGFVSRGEANSLRAQLETALALLAKGATRPAIGVLQAFIRDVEGMLKNGRLTADEAAWLLEQARRAITAAA